MHLSVWHIPEAGFICEMFLIGLVPSYKTIVYRSFEEECHFINTLFCNHVLLTICSII